MATATAAMMRWLRSLVRWSLRISVGVVVLALLLVVGVYGSLRSGLVAASLDGLITRLAQEEGVFFVRVEGVSGDLPEHLRVRKVEIGDYYGVWLTLEDAEARWHPFDLFHPFDDVKFRINVDDITARRVEWTRLPKDGPDEVDEPFRWDRLVRILIGHLRVDELDLTGSLLDGARSRVRAEGSGILGEWHHGFVKLDIAHVDDVAGSARVDLRTHGSPLELEGTITAEEGPGGALAALARLPEAGAVKLDVRASGPMRDWRGEADVTASGIGKLSAAVKLAFTAEGPFEVTGSFDPVAEQRERWLVGEGAPMSVFAKGAWAPDVELRLDRVQLGADGRQLTADGRLDLASMAFDVKGRVEHESKGQLVATTLVDVTGATIQGSGVLGDAGKLDATLDLEAPAVGGVSGKTLRATVKATDAPGDSVPTFQLNVNADGLELDDGELPIIGDSARLVASGRVDLLEGVLVADNASFEGKALTVKGPLSFADEWSSMKASLVADVSSLESLARVYETSVSGSASAAIDLAAKADWQDLEMAIRANSVDVKVGEPGWNALIGGASTLEANVRGAPRGPAHGDLVLKAAGITVTSKAKVGADGHGLEGDAHFVMDNLAKLAEPTRAAVAGRLEATAKARGSLDRFDLDVALRGDRFSWEGVRFDTLTADVDAQGLPSTWSATIRSQGSYGKQSASLDAALSMPKAGHLVARDVVLSGPRTQGSASLDVQLDSWLASGTVLFKSDDLALWRPMTGLAIGGSAVVDATLGVTLGVRGVAGHGASATQQVSGTATVKRGVMPFETTEISVEALEVSAQGVEVGPRPRGSARVHATQLRQGSRILVEGVATATGDGRLWTFETKLDARDGEILRLDAAGTLAPGPPMEITLSRATSDVGTTAIELLDAASLRYAAGDGTDWSTSPVAFRIGDAGRLSGQASMTKGKARLDAEATALPLAVATLFYPDLDLEGSVDGKVKLEGTTLATAAGEMSIRGRDVASVGLEVQGVDPVDVEVDARLGSGRITGTAGVTGLNDAKLVLTLAAPLEAASGGAPLEVRLVWNGSLAETMVLLPLGDDSLSGRIDADLRLTGTINAPRVTGRAVIDGGKWEQTTTGMVLHDIRAELEGSGTSLELRRFAATDGENGTVTATGRLRFGTLPAFDAELDLDASRAMLTRLDVISTRADAKLAVRASRSAAVDADIEGSILGTVHLDDVRIEIPQSFVSDIPEIQVIEVGVEASAEAVRAAQRVALDLDVAVTGDNRIFVTGRGLESEWSSDIHVRGNTADPRILGKITSVRGQLSLLGRRFDVQSARLQFDGEKGNVPYLTMTARAEANDVTAIAVVTGPATRPAIELRSEPTLPRDEVLSRLLFGQSAANLTPMQSVQLARSVAELAGSPLAGGGGFLSGIGSTLGFDSLGVESSGSDGAAALTASKYLTDDVYLRVQGGLTPEASKLSLEWRVFKNLTIDSDVSQDAQGEVGVTWRWDY